MIAFKACEECILSIVKQNELAFAQNGTKPSTVASILHSETMSDITAKLEQAEEIERKQAERTAQLENQSAQELEQKKAELQKEYEQFKNMLDIQKQELDHDRLDNRQLIKGEVDIQVKQTEAGLNTENPSDIIDAIERNNLERKKSDEEERLHKKAEQQKDRELDLKQEEIRVKEKDTDNKLKIAKENKNKYDKPQKS